ncbi:MAG: hypothetical protein RIQ52_543 [Pseudomonadota bacterium]
MDGDNQVGQAMQPDSIVALSPEKLMDALQIHNTALKCL